MMAGDSSPSVAGLIAAGGAGGAIPLMVSLPAGETAPVLGAGGVAGPIGPAGAPETSAAAPGGGLAEVAAIGSCVFADAVVSGRARPATALASNALRARYGSTSPWPKTASRPGAPRSRAVENRT